MTDLPPGERFARCLKLVLKHEGGYVDQPRDPGGATNLGITRKTLARWRKVTPWWKLPKSAVKALALPEAAAIYEASYWKRVEGSRLPDGLDLALFDFAVNSGPVRAVRALQQNLGVRADGWIGPLTLDALQMRIASAGIAGLITALCDGRLGWLKRLATFAIFGRGWTRRVDDIRSAALEMAGTVALPPTQRKTDMNLLAGYKTYIVAAIMLLTGLAGLIGLDIPGFDSQAPASLVMEALAFFFLRRGLKADLSNA